MAKTRKITNSAGLEAGNKELEEQVMCRRRNENEFCQVKENLHPKRVIKNTFSYVAETPEIQKTLVNTVIGFDTGLCI